MNVFVVEVNCGDGGGQGRVQKQWVTDMFNLASKGTGTPPALGGFSETSVFFPSLTLSRRLHTVFCVSIVHVGATVMEFCCVVTLQIIHLVELT